MDPGALVERLKRYAVDSDLPDPDGLDLRDDLTVDRIAAVLLTRFHAHNDAEALALVYEVARGGLDWGPLQRYRNLAADAAAVSPERTLSSTVRRVGTEGRLDDTNDAAA